MVSKTIIEDVLYEALSTGGDFAEVFVEKNRSTELLLLGGQVETGLAGSDFGIGIRIFCGNNSVYAYTNENSRESLIKLTQKAAKAIRRQKKDIILKAGRMTEGIRHKVLIPPGTVDMSKKIELARRAHLAAKNYDACISQTNIRYIDQEQNVMIANSEGLMAEDQRIRTRMLITAVAEKQGDMQSAYKGPGALKGMEFYEEISIEDYAREAAKMAKAMCGADHCPAGKMPVVVDNAFGGLMFHEACGHSLEASCVAKGLSVFSSMLGKKIASEVLTLVDDGTILNAWGSYGVDDEGIPAQKNVLIENGILKSYLIDKLSGRRLGMPATGSARRQSYRWTPTSRMSNTYIAAGKHTREEIIANTEYGLFAKNLGAGSVDPVTGEFNFSVIEGYIIRNGRIDKPVKGATLIGKGEEILKKVDMVGSNLEFGQGYCMADSGTVFVSMGQPTLRIQSITVGGRVR